MGNYISEARMRRYFSKNKAWRYATLFFVIAAFSISIFYLLQMNDLAYEYYIHYLYNLSPSSFIYGALVGTLLGVIIIIVAYSTAPTDAEYDAWVENRRKMIIDNAFDKLRININQIVSNPYIPGPLIIKGFIDPLDEEMRKRYSKDINDHKGNKIDVEDVEYKVGKDGMLRCSVNTLLYIALLEDYIAIFYSDINALEQSQRYQETAHYYYHDVVGITTDDEQIPLSRYVSGAKNGVALYQRFSLEVSNGESVGTSLLIDKRTLSSQDLDKMHSLVVFDSEVDRTISALLMFLRDKKQGKLNSAQAAYPTQP